MYSRNANLASPLNIDVARIASFYPEFFYRGPLPENWLGEAVTSEYIINHSEQHRFAVLFFDGKTKDGFTTITTYYEPRELAALFKRLPQEFASQLISALKGTSLEIPTLSESEYYEINEAYEARKSRLQILTSVQAPIKNVRKVDFKSSESVIVLQHEYAVTSPDSDQPVLGTFGAGPCVILALYDQQNKKAVLAHIDALTNIHSLTMLFAAITPEHTVAHLAGGNSSSLNMCIEIVELLQSNGIKIATADLVRESLNSASMAIDSRTGAVYSDVLYGQLNQTPDINLRLQIAGLQFMKSPIKQCYNGLKAKATTAAAPFSGAAQSDVLPKMPGLNVPRLTLSFITVEKNPQKNPVQQQTYCGFKPGFLNK